MAIADGSSRKGERDSVIVVWHASFLLSLALSADDDVITNSSAYDLLTLRARPERRATRRACESGRDAGSSGRVYGPRCAMAGSPLARAASSTSFGARCTIRQADVDDGQEDERKGGRERESGNGGTFLFCERDYGISEPHSLLPLSHPYADGGAYEI